MDTLKKVLRRLEPGTKIKVGTKDGKGWFYIGTSDELEIHFNEYDLLIDKMWATKLRKTRDLLRSLIMHGGTMEGYVRKELKKHNPELSPNGYEEYLKIYFNEVVKIKRAAEKYEIISEDHTKLQSREVYETFLADSIVDLGYLNIQIAGEERGAFWDSKEADTIPIIRFDIKEDDDILDENEIEMEAAV